MEGQLVDEDSQIAEMARRTAKVLAKGERVFVPVVVRAIRQRCGLTQREAGLLFGTGEKSFEKDESGGFSPPCQQSACSSWPWSGLNYSSGLRGGKWRPVWTIMAPSFAKPCAPPMPGGFMRLCFKGFAPSFTARPHGGVRCY